MRHPLGGRGFSFACLKISLMSGLALAAIPGLAADQRNPASEDNNGTAPADDDTADYAANSVEAANFLGGWLDGNGVWFPYCTTSGDTGDLGGETSTQP